MDIGQLATITGASRVTGVPRSTIRSAIDRGEIERYEMGDGTVVVDLEELRVWQRKRAAVVQESTGN